MLLIGATWAARQRLRGASSLGILSQTRFGERHRPVDPIRGVPCTTDRRSTTPSVDRSAQAALIEIVLILFAGLLIKVETVEGTNDRKVISALLVVSAAAVFATPVPSALLTHGAMAWRTARDKLRRARAVASTALRVAWPPSSAEPSDLSSVDCSSASHSSQCSDLCDDEAPPPVPSPPPPAPSPPPLPPAANSGGSTVSTDAKLCRSDDVVSTPEPSKRLKRATGQEPNY